MCAYVYIIAPLIGWAVAQAIKFVLVLRKDGISVGDAFQSGGMPSSHAAFVTALTTIVAKSFGLSSIEFALAASFSAVVLYDAAGVRRTVGEHTLAVKELARHSQKELSAFIHDAKGHSIIEVLAGTILGIAVGLICYYIC